MTEDAHRAAEQAAREHYSRVLASLAAQFRDIAAAEDALSDSLVAALDQWPRVGVPERPAAWLLAVARRRLTDALRRQATRDAAAAAIAYETGLQTGETEMEDKRLQLLFACAHPAIAEHVRAPLMLQVVCGLDAAVIAATFLTSPAAMAQRLVRAKQKIRDAGIPFRIPEPEEYPERLGAVLTAIYALFAAGYNAAPETAARPDTLRDEAIWLGHLVVVLSGRQAEALGLLALMLFVESRRNARRDANGGYVPLAEQDTALWDAALIGRAENLLREAAGKIEPGQFQTEAAIQSVHAARLHSGATDWPTILMLYDALFVFAPSSIVAVNRALAVLHVHGAAAARATLDACADDERLADYQPYWAVRAHVLAKAGHRDDAELCYARAMALETDPAARAFLERERSRLAPTP